MKKLRSLVASFAIATAGLTGLAAAPASAQTVPVYAQQQATSTMYVSQEAINDIAVNVGVQNVYPRAGKGFTAATAGTGETIGLEFQLNGNSATVIRAFNLDDPYANRAFNDAQASTANYERSLAARFNNSYYAYPHYNVGRSLLPIIGLGLLFSNNHHHDYRGWDNRHYDNRRYVAPRYVEPRREHYRREEPRFQPRQQHDRQNWGGGQRHQGGGHHRH